MLALSVAGFATGGDAAPQAARRRYCHRRLGRPAHPFLVRDGGFTAPGINGSPSRSVARRRRGLTRHLFARRRAISSRRRRRTPPVCRALRHRRYVHRRRVLCSGGRPVARRRRRRYARRPAPVLIFVRRCLGARLIAPSGYAVLSRRTEGRYCLSIDYQVAPHHRWPRHILDVRPPSRGHG